MTSAATVASRHLAPRPSLGFLIALPLLLSLAGPVAGSAYVQEPASGEAPEDIWSDEYVAYEFPWGGDEAVQFKEYHDYESMRTRMLRLAEDNSDFVNFHEGLNGGTNARGQETTEDTYKGWFYGHPSPWLKITGDIEGGEYNAFNGDTGNYVDREDVLIVGNHHAREWMSYEVPMFMIETLIFSFNNIGYDNDGDGLVDEDPWGDADGDGILDDDGDCLRLDPSFQDSDGDGTPCGPGDLGVDEDFSEQKLHDLINAREIYIVPMLNVDGNRYDREVYCGETAWENCATSGWRKNLRDNTVTGITPLPDLDEEVDESCDGVDLNRNYQFEWGAPLGATGPLIPGSCYASGPNNDVYNGPVDTVDQDGDGRLNEDGVDGKDDDSDGLVDEDWLGGNSEPETKFIQDLTEMNDELENGGSDFPAVLTWHSFSELILYPWGHCQDCTNPDQDQLKFHGDVMATMSNYENMQSSSLYPTSGDFCDWHYGLFNSYCYTMEIGNAFHERPENIDDILLRNVGMGMYMIEIADNPRERADLAIANISQQNYLKQPSKVNIPDSGDIPVDLCVSDMFPYSVDETSVKWRQVKPSRMQSDYGPREWSTTPWQMAEVVKVDGGCPLAAGNGTMLRAMLPISETATGEIHYKAMVSTLSGADFYPYPADGGYYTLDISYRAAFGSVFGALFTFGLVATFVWGGLAVALRIMLGDDEDKVFEADLQSGA
jgi:hypothetical protein